MDVSEPVATTCPVERTLRVIAGRWKPSILWELTPGSRRFNQLQAALPGIAHKVLSQQLERLQADGLVRRTEPAQAGTVGYALTPLGESLRPALNALATWGKVHG